MPLKVVPFHVFLLAQLKKFTVILPERVLQADAAAPLLRPSAYSIESFLEYAAAFSLPWTFFKILVVTIDITIKPRYTIVVIKKFTKQKEPYLFSLLDNQKLGGHVV